MDRVAGPQKMVGTGIFSKSPPYRAFPAAGDPKHRRRQTVPLLRLRPTSVMRSIKPRPHGNLKLSQGRRLLDSAVPQRRFPFVCRQLQHPRPSTDPSVPFFAKIFRKRRPRPIVGRVSASIYSRKRHIGLAEREIHVPVYGYYVFLKPSVPGFPTDRSFRYLV
jgi:hypothetical protein